jgi:alginate O-acetyltransferase complex protein AlgJ
MINRKFLTLLPTLAFTALLLAGLAVSVMSLKAVSSEEWAELASISNILSGESTRRFTKLLNQHFVLGKTFNQIERGIQWNLTGDLGPGVRGGCDDWLFLADELEVYPDRIKSAQFRLSLAEQLAARLNERGIKLLMVVVPDKTRIESAHLCSLKRSALFDKRIANWLDTLNGHGIKTLNLTPVLAAMPGERYYHTDTHWNEAGANASAQAIASRLGELGWAQVVSDAVKLNSARTPRSGDLIHLAGLDGLPGFLRPKAELVQTSRIAPIAVASDDLFGDAGLPTIALIGTSYSKNSNFVPFLEHHLGAPVANLARDGGDFAGAATDYFGGKTFKTDPPRVVIWEIPERVLEKPLNDTERKWQQMLAKGIM